MKKTFLFLLTFCMVMSSCSYKEFSAAATGSALGGMFGSSIGGLMNGPRGYHAGRVAGMTIGAAAGLAAVSEDNHKEQRHEVEQYEDYVEYGQYEAPRNNRSYTTNYNPYEGLEIDRIRFSDANNSHALEPGEHASLVMIIFNRSDRTLYNVGPQITCDNRQICISPTANISELAPGQGFRYRAEVIATKRLKSGETYFSVSFGNGKNKYLAKSFRIRTSN